MAKGDIMPLENTGASKMDASIPYYIAAGATTINPGEPVQKLAGAAGVTALLTNSPTTTNRIVGVASAISTQTASVSGTVQVIPMNSGQIWIMAPKVAATWNTQAAYNNLVGSRVLIDLTSGLYTILATDGASNGCVVEYIDISRYPGVVAFSFNPLCDYRAV